MRNVITLSDVPRELHDWLKTEAARRTKLSGKRVGIYQVVVQAVREYKDRLESRPSRRRRVIPKMELFRKKIRPSELGRGCMCVPKARQFYFGRVGNTIAMQDAADSSTCLIPVQSQYRLKMDDYYSRHTAIKVGDEIVFEQIDGTIHIRLLPI